MSTALERVQMESSELAKLTTLTLGPRGRSVLISRPEIGEVARMTKDGATVCKFFLPELPGAELLKQAAQEAEGKTGDGTTTTVLLCDYLIENGRLTFQQTQSLKRAAALAVDYLEGKSCHNFDIFNVAKTSMNNDVEAAKLVAKAFEAVPNGAIELTDGVDDDLRIISGARFDSGWISPLFSLGKAKLLYENPLVFISNDTLERLDDVLIALETAAEQKRPLVVIAPDVKDEALQVLLANSLNKTVNCVAIRAPGYGNTKTANCQDIAAMCNGKEIKEQGKHVFAFLGECNKLQCDQRQFFVAFNANDDLKKILQLVKEQKCDSSFEEVQRRERIARLEGKLAEIEVGGSSEAEQRERRDRFEDAIGACRVAMEGGVVPGGGSMMLQTARMLESLREGTEDDKKMRTLLANALKEELFKICENADISGQYIAEKLNNDEVYDIVNKKFGNYQKMGVVDATSVLCESIKTATDMASQVVRIGGDIREKQDKKSKEPSVSDFDY